MVRRVTIHNRSRVTMGEAREELRCVEHRHRCRFCYEGGELTYALPACAVAK